MLSNVSGLENSSTGSVKRVGTTVSGFELSSVNRLLSNRFTDAGCEECAMMNTVTVSIEVEHEIHPEESMVDFTVTVEKRPYIRYEFDFPAHKNLLSTSDEEILEKIRACDDDAWELIVAETKNGIDIPLNGGQNFCKEVILRMATEVISTP